MAEQATIPISATRGAWTAVGLLAGLVGLAGCAPAIRLDPQPPRDAQQAMRRINGNLLRIEGALYCKALVSFHFRDTNGVQRRFVGHPATIIFERPRCLYFDIKHTLAGSVARIGSNDERYWLWVDLQDTRKLWYGTWQALERGLARKMIVPPDELLDALLMRPLPEELPEGIHPLLESDGRISRLLFIEVDGQRWPWVRREMVLDSQPPFLPIEIIDRLPDGRVAMHARLGNYRRVGGTGPAGPYTARHYVVQWNQDGAEMRIDLSDVRYRTRETPFCEFPEGWDGQVIRLDQTPAPDARAPIEAMPFETIPDTPPDAVPPGAATESEEPQ